MINKRFFEEGGVIWITGLSGAGKSSLAIEVTLRLKKYSSNVILLDGDELRIVFATNNYQTGVDYTKNERLEKAMQYARLCRYLSEQGFIVVIATISMFNEIYRFNRLNLHNYFEVFLDVPLKELYKRDPKGIYSRYKRGKLRNIAGLDLLVDLPKNAHWSPRFSSKKSLGDLTNELISILGR